MTRAKNKIFTKMLLLVMVQVFSISTICYPALPGPSLSKDALRVPLGLGERGKALTERQRGPALRLIGTGLGLREFQIAGQIITVDIHEIFNSAVAETRANGKRVRVLDLFSKEERENLPLRYKDAIAALQERIRNFTRPNEPEALLFIPGLHQAFIERLQAAMQAQVEDKDSDTVAKEINLVAQALAADIILHPGTGGGRQEAAINTDAAQQGLLQACSAALRARIIIHELIHLVLRLEQKAHPNEIDVQEEDRLLAAQFGLMSFEDTLAQLRDVRTARADIIAKRGVRLAERKAKAEELQPRAREEREEAETNFRAAEENYRIASRRHEDLQGRIKKLTERLESLRRRGNDLQAKLELSKGLATIETQLNRLIQRNEDQKETTQAELTKARDEEERAKAVLTSELAVAQKTLKQAKEKEKKIIKRLGAINRSSMLQAAALSSLTASLEPLQEAETKAQEVLYIERISERFVLARLNGVATETEDGLTEQVVRHLLQREAELGRTVIDKIFIHLRAEGGIADLRDLQEIPDIVINEEKLTQIRRGLVTEVRAIAEGFPEEYLSFTDHNWELLFYLYSEGFTELAYLRERVPGLLGLALDDKVIPTVGLLRRIKRNNPINYDELAGLLKHDISGLQYTMFLAEDDGKRIYSGGQLLEIYTTLDGGCSNEVRMGLNQYLSRDPAGAKQLMSRIFDSKVAQSLKRKANVLRMQAKVAINDIESQARFIVGEELTFLSGEADSMDGDIDEVTYERLERTLREVNRRRSLYKTGNLRLETLPAGARQLILCTLHDGIVSDRMVTEQDLALFREQVIDKELSGEPSVKEEARSSYSRALERLAEFPGMEFKRKVLGNPDQACQDVERLIAQLPPVIDAAMILSAELVLEAQRLSGLLANNTEKLRNTRAQQEKLRREIRELENGEEADVAHNREKIEDRRGQLATLERREAMQIASLAELGEEIRKFYDEHPDFSHPGIVLKPFEKLEPQAAQAINHIEGTLRKQFGESERRVLGELFRSGMPGQDLQDIARAVNVLSMSVEDRIKPAVAFLKELLKDSPLTAVSVKWILNIDLEAVQYIKKLAGERGVPIQIWQDCRNAYSVINKLAKAENGKDLVARFREDREAARRAVGGFFDEWQQAQETATTTVDEIRRTPAAAAL